MYMRMQHLNAPRGAAGFVRYADSLCCMKLLLDCSCQEFDRSICSMTQKQQGQLTCKAGLVTRTSASRMGALSSAMLCTGMGSFAVPRTTTVRPRTTPSSTCQGWMVSPAAGRPQGCEQGAENAHA